MLRAAVLPAEMSPVTATHRKAATMNIADTIRQLRTELGMTQEQVARRLGVSAPAVNKWERGVSYPDITLIPALARLLKTDANTLLAFEPELTRDENLAIQRETERLVREEDYEAGFAFAQEQLRRYPSSDELAICLAGYLDGALALYQVGHPELYRPSIDGIYERLASSDVPEVRDRALNMLIAAAMGQKRYDEVQRLLDGAPSTQIDKEERQAVLYMRTGDDEAALRLWESRLIRMAGDIVLALGGLVEIAMREGRVDDAREQARRARLVMEALDMPVWMGMAPELTVAVAKQDVAGSIEVLEQTVGSMRSTDAAALKSPLYRYAEMGMLTQMLQQMSDLVLAEVETEDEYAFLRESKQYQEWRARLA